MNQIASETASETTAAKTTTTQPEDEKQHQQRPQAYILIENPMKSNNLGPLIRTCVAFSIQEIVIVGYDKFSCNGSFGSDKYIICTAFPTFRQAVDYLKEEKCCSTVFGLLSHHYPKDCAIVGNNDVSYNECDVVLSNDFVIDSDTNTTTTSTTSKKSYPIHEISFSDKNVCFYISKRIDTLQKQYCTDFMHIPCHFDFTDLPTKLAIILHHFMTSVGCYEERISKGYKYCLDREKKVSNNNGEEKKKKRRETSEKNIHDEDDALNLLNDFFI